MSDDLDPSDGMISRAALASEVLLFRMKMLSQEFYAEPWIDGLEFEVWDMAFNGHKLFNRFEVTETMSKYFRDLATLADGWWVQEDETQPGQAGPVFITTERWQQILTRSE
jgi:hypothetical protein